MKYTLQEVIEDIKNGIPVIIVDDPDREHEGDLFIISEKLTYGTLLFGIKCGGYVCVTGTRENLDKLGLYPMVRNSTCRLGTGFQISTDLLGHGVTSGVSCGDRLKTILAIADEKTTHKDLAKPGHIQVLCARNGLLKERRGHTECSLELAKLAGMKPWGVIVEIMDDDGEMMRGKRLEDFAIKHNFKIISIAEIYDYIYNQD